MSEKEQQQVRTKKGITLYDAFVPVWFFVAIPAAWLVLLPVNFITDSIVLWFVAKAFDVRDIKALWKSCIVRVFLVGFVANLIGALFLFLSQGYFGEWWYEYITTPVALNPLDNIYALVFTVLGVVVAGAVGYLLNRKLSFKRTQIEERAKRNISLALAILTAPFLFLMPSRSFYDPETPLYTFTNHIVWAVRYACDVTPVKCAVTEGAPLTYADGFLTSYALADAINHARPANSTITRDPDYTMVFYNPEDETDTGLSAEMWFTAENLAVFRIDGKWYLADEYDTEQVRLALAGELTYTPPEEDAADAPSATTAV